MTSFFYVLVVVMVLLLIWASVTFFFNQRESHESSRLSETKPVSSSQFTSVTMKNMNMSTVSSIPFYSEHENKLHEIGITWADFLDTKQSRARSGLLHIPIEVYNSLTTCPLSMVTNLSAKLSSSDVAWCHWAANVTNGVNERQKQPSESSTSTSSTSTSTASTSPKLAVAHLDSADNAKFEKLKCSTVLKGRNPSCDDVSIGTQKCISIVLGFIDF